MKNNETRHTEKFSGDMVPTDAPAPGPDWNDPLPKELPEPTPWPFVLAVGTILLAWGVVTSWVLSLIGGVVAAIGLGGWIERMRNEQTK